MHIKNILPATISRTIKQQYLNCRGIWYGGSKYHCSICKKSYRKMLPGGFDLDIIKKQEIIGSGLRKNNICPGCQSTDRDRLIYNYLDNSGFFTKIQKVLHVSPEPSLYKVISKIDNIDYIVGTKYSEGIYYPHKIMSIDLLDLPFGDGEFDFVMCNHVLEHIVDDTTAIKELYRVLKNGGSGILQVPISWKISATYENSEIKSEKDREVHFGQFDHVRIYGKDYLDRLQSAGFSVEEFIPNEKDTLKYALNPKEKLFVVHKKKCHEN